ncbi:hypothetical protein [uncultured Bacteroides sp.]|uniref:hypothetical protein n=1 Tax=uncultured Bacteroides sp. TaxID=162156 RepID=UPI0025E22D73|nr:hypothetical protein [uncultured Bacteroides sp.]
MQEVQKHRSISPGVSPCIVERQRFNSKRKKGAPQAAHPKFQESGNDFLKEYISHIPSKNEEDLPVELDEELTLQSMYKVMSNYLGLMGTGFRYQLTGNFRNDISSLYSEFITHLPIQTYADMNLTEDYGYYGLNLYLYHYPKVLRDELVFFPIGKVELMPKDIGTLFIDFVGFYYKTQCVLVPEESHYFSWVLNERAEEAEECANSTQCQMSEEERTAGRELAKCAVNYQYGGSYYPYYDCIINYVPQKEDLSARLRSAAKTSVRENQRLVECLIEGVEICSKGCITKYDYIEGNDDNIFLDVYLDQFEPVEMRETFVIVWDQDDEVVNESMEYINEMIREAGCSGVCQYQLLTEETNALFEKSSFPVEFSLWFSKMIKVLDEYGTNK